MYNRCMKGGENMKVQVNLSDDLVSRIDKFAKAMGVSRSALCGVWIGQSLMGMEKTLEVGQKAIENILTSEDVENDLNKK
jgi:predicted transcriptional regulator